MEKSMQPDFSNQSNISPLQQFPSSQKPQVLADQHVPIITEEEEEKQPSV